MRRGAAAIGFVALVAAACGAAPTPSSAAPATAVASGPPVATPTATPSEAGLALNIENSTTVAVRLLVNGTLVATVPPFTTEAPIAAALPALPWAILVEAPSGRTLLALDVAGPGGPGAGASDLACGRLVVSAGRQFHVEPTFIPDPSKPCD